MPDEKGFVESLFDFSFREVFTKKYVKFLYAIHLLLGLVAAIVFIVSGFQVSPSQGLIDLLIGLVALCFWVIYVRLTLECLVAVLGMAENMARVARGPN